MRTLILTLSACILLAAPASAGDPLKRLARKLEKGARGQANKKVAVLSFPYHDGASSEGSSIVQERLTTYLAERGKVEVIERALLRKVLEEKKLELTGVVDPKTTSELGKILGVGALVTGTLNDLKEGRTEVNARVIEAETGQIIAAGQAVVERSWKGGPVLTVSTDGDPKTPGGDFRGKPLVQLAILLDTSNSMDGLIHQAKTQLWRIVNELAGSEKGGGSPDIQVSLYEYGNDGLHQGENYLRMVLPFTSDLDKVSERLFALRTNGGQEFAGAAIRDAARGLAWDRRADVYKAIFVAGNEPFTQGPVDFREAVAEAVSRGIVVNTIFCGNRQEGIATQWLAGASAGGGSFLHIDQEARVAAFSAPQDAEIERLGLELNKTYVPYGAKGKTAYENQAAQDSNAAMAPAAGALVQRAIFKASRQYAQAAASWDAVSEVESGRLKPEELRKDELPEGLRRMDDKARKEHIEAQVRRRKELQERIGRLNEERRKYVARKEREAAAGGARTLDSAVLQAVREQAAKKGYRFKE